MHDYANSYIARASSRDRKISRPSIYGAYLAISPLPDVCTDTGQLPRNAYWSSLAVSRSGLRNEIARREALSRFGAAAWAVCCNSTPRADRIARSAVATRSKSANTVPPQSPLSYNYWFDSKVSSHKHTYFPILIRFLLILVLSLFALFLLFCC